LILAQHSELGLVTSKIALDDDTRVDLTPEQNLNLLFTLPQNVYDIQYFIFELNGYNRKLLV